MGIQMQADMNKGCMPDQAGAQTGPQALTQEIITEWCRCFLRCAVCRALIIMASLSPIAVSHNCAQCMPSLILPGAATTKQSSSAHHKAGCKGVRLATPEGASAVMRAM